MIKKLPFKQPDISYEPCTNHIMSIINSDVERFQCALYNNFIDIVITSTANFYGVKDWLNYHMFENYKIPREILLNKNTYSIIELIKEWIDEEKYVCVFFNTYYVSNYPTYNKKNFNHYAMIFGYDTEDNSFLCADFFDFNYYSVQKCSMNEVVDAIIHNENPKKRDYESDFLLLKVEDIAAPKLYVNKIITSLYTLIAKNNLSYSRGYGLYIFNNISAIIKNGNLEGIRHELKRKAHFIVIHMEIMIMRIKYLYTISGDKRFNEIANNILEIKKQAEQFRNYVLKLMLLNQWIFPDNTKDKNIDLLMTIRKKYELNIKLLIGLLLEVDIY